MCDNLVQCLALLTLFQEDNLNYKDGAFPLKGSRKEGRQLGAQIILGATIGGKITQYARGREIKPAVKR